MLELIDIKKDYAVAGGAVHALNGVSLKFRKNEFVSILGASGCGKTTLLNIIGGLDKYTSGDLIIAGTSTKEFKDGDWDTYRNHSIGFIFQSYHLIPHQTILQNVELALTISGVPKEERRRRAVEALEKVGLADKLNNRPNQLSGGQAQRVAIARALINDPEIVLADEPTGALDSKTSVQIMELLKEISKEKLVIMVTHNPELAEQYSTRIIRLLDGVIIDDTMPYDGDENDLPHTEDQSADSKEILKTQDSTGVTEKEEDKKTGKGRKKKSSMSVGMAFSLSLKNLLSKFKRTALVSIAGSIGIIGVSMVLAISAGVQAYIKDMEDDMLSGYPVSITRSAIDYTSLMQLNNNATQKVDITKLDDKIYVNSLMETLGSFSTGFTKMNVITDNYISYVEAMPKEYYNVMQFGYDFEIANNVYTDFKVKSDSVIDGGADASANMSVTAIRAMYASVLGEQEEYKQWASTISTVATFKEVPDSADYILSQYDVVASSLKGEDYTAALSKEEINQVFASEDSLIMVVDDMEVADLVMGQFGYLTEEEFLNYAYKAVDSDAYKPSIGLIGGQTENGENGLSYEFFLGENAKKFTYYSNDSAFREVTPQEKIIYEAQTQKTVDYTYNPYSKDFTEEGLDLKVKLILQKKEDLSYGCLASGFYYTNALTNKILQSENNEQTRSGIVKHILSTGKSLEVLPYAYRYSFEQDGKFVTKPAGGVIISNDSASIMNMLISGLGGGLDYSVSASMLGGSDMPASIFIYPVNFDCKNQITDYLDGWNRMCENGESYGTAQALGEKDKITYTDTVGLIINMVNTMIEMITVALIAFTALSLVVSTVMVGIITYVSVVERIKEIGILRAVGARKKDIKRLFNAETFIIGFAAGFVGIAVTYLLSLIINLIVGVLFGIYTIAALPIWQAAIMLTVSVALTLISGLIPAAAAAKKDPVVALRTE